MTDAALTLTRTLKLDMSKLWQCKTRSVTEGIAVGGSGTEEEEVHEKDVQESLVHAVFSPPHTTEYTPERRDTRGQPQ